MQSVAILVPETLILPAASNGDKVETFFKSIYWGGIRFDPNKFRTPPKPETQKEFKTKVESIPRSR